MSPADRHAIHAAMVRFADGDRTAFRAVFDGLWPLLSAFAARSLSPEDAADAAQRALLRVFSRIVDLDRDRDGVAWALTITSYEVLTLRKQRARRREAGAALDDDHGPDPGAASPEQHAIERQLGARLRDAIAALPALDQHALEPVLLGGPIDPGETARKRRFRALHRLRELWRKIHD